MGKCRYPKFGTSKIIFSYKAVPGITLGFDNQNLNIESTKECGKFRINIQICF